MGQQTEGGSTRGGVGAITVRTKVNLWGNDEAEQPLRDAFLAFVSAPGSSERVFNLGVILPFRWISGPECWSSTWHEVPRPRRVAMIGSASLDAYRRRAFVPMDMGHDRRRGSAAWEATYDLGLTLGIGRNKTDAGLNLALPSGRGRILPRPRVSFLARPSCPRHPC